ncbi:MAG: hypothetical protein Q8L81_05345 [Bacteroidota bacterium]|nr:hypothetical protein [Bacteroidota bacterium]
MKTLTMKTLITFRFISIIIFTVILISQTSCVSFYTKDNGKHKGWYKNSNNPHHPNSTNPGNSHGKSKGKSKK